MKFELSEHSPSITVKRTLKILTDTLTELLAEEPFEKITVMQICNHSMIPRATFYNYFDDKYDFLDYYWAEHFMQVLPHIPQKSYNTIDYLTQVLENLSLYLQKHFDTSKSIYKINQHGQFFLSMLNYVTNRTMKVLEYDTELQKSTSTPLSLTANFLASSTLTIGFWWIEHQEEATLEDICSYFRLLVKNTL